MTSPSELRSVGIVGGGTVGYLTALALRTNIIGVGEDPPPPPLAGARAMA